MQKRKSVGTGYWNENIKDRRPGKTVESGDEGRKQHALLRKVSWNRYLEELLSMGEGYRDFGDVVFGSHLLR